MKKLLLALGFFISISVNAAESVILMIGDGMGVGHVACRGKQGGFLATQTPAAMVSTSNSEGEITNSPPAATAFSCGIKTRNGYAGVDRNGVPCPMMISRMARDAGYTVVIATNDSPIGGTPTPFFARSVNRYDAGDLRAQFEATNIRVISNEAGFGSSAMARFPNRARPARVEFGTQKICMRGRRPFFVMVEEAAIDWTSHDGDFANTMRHMADFETAVQSAIAFVKANHNITLIVVGDHETGGLSPETCEFGSFGSHPNASGANPNSSRFNHTGADVPLYAYGSKASLFQSATPIENDEVGRRIRSILFP
ncbi:MAG: alkaline phosphatase [Alphaproteobacteria bacterium]|nr:alkaline phosphatase [Alphaproteobacteria bacterium]